jgi:hypothetical protein
VVDNKNPEDGKKKKAGYRTFVDVVAAIVAVAIAFVAIIVIANDSDLAGPKTTTVVSKDAIAASGGTRKTTNVVTKGPHGKLSRTVTREKNSATPAKPAETTTTTEDGQRTFLERILGNGGLVILQIAVAVIAAFLAGAIVQRVLLGEYGGFKFGNFELSSVARASSTSVEKLGDDLKKAREEADNAIKGAKAESAKEDGDIRKELAIIYKHLDLIEKRIPG